MPKELILNRRGDMLIAVDNESLDVLRSLPQEESMRAKIVMRRNESFHRKAFAMVKLAFDYWQPTNYLTSVERHTVRHLHDYLVRNGIEKDTVSALCTDFLCKLNEHRADYEFTKDSEVFREFVTVQAGFYETVISPAGPRKVPRSWAFANMDEEEFGRMYKAIFDVCWNLILKQHFESHEAAETAAEQLLSYS